MSVTNTQLAAKLDTLTSDINKYRLAQEKRIVYLETCLPMLKKDVDNLKKRDYIVGGGAGILAVLASIIGVNK